MINIAITVLIGCGCLVLLAAAYLLVGVRDYLWDKLKNKPPTVIQQIASVIKNKDKKEPVVRVSVVDQINQKLNEDELRFRGDLMSNEKI